MKALARAVFLAACGLLAVPGYATSAPAQKPVSAAPAASAKPWPFTPRQARLVMLMDKAHPARSSDGRQLWALTADLAYRTHAGDTITVPKGMVSDLASVPRFAQNVVPSDGDYAQAALVHDFLFKTTGTCVLVVSGKLPDGKTYRHATTKDCSRAAPYTREEANAILDQAMADIGVSTWRRWVIMGGLYVGSKAGWGH
jgi:hypothetical protein